MSKTVVLKEILAPNDFDPMNIDISEFQELSNKIPKDGDISIANASVLASIYLRAADRCSEIVSVLIWQTKDAKRKKNQIRQEKYLLAKDEGHKTIDDKRAYSESHPDYIEASERLDKVEAVKKWFEDKHEWFLESHRYMKMKLKTEGNHMNSSGFSETAGINEDGEFGEKKW